MVVIQNLSKAMSRVWMNQNFTLKYFSIGVWNFIKKNNHFLTMYSFLVYFHLSVLINNQHLSTLNAVFYCLLQDVI